MALIDKTFSFKAGGAAAIVVIVIIVSGVSYGMGALFSSTTSTIALTTSTLVSVTTFTGTAQTSFLTSYVIQTTSSLVTITDTGPATILLTGLAHSNTIGTFATDVLFTLATNNQTVYDAKITQGNQFSQTLPNHNAYLVSIKYGTTLSNVGAGQCAVGLLEAYFGNVVPTVDFHC